MKLKKILKSHSPYILFVCIAQIILSIVATLALVYSDSKIFGDVAILNDLERLITSIYSQSWWALILFSLSLASVLTLTAIVYKKLEYEFISIGCIFIMILPSINISSKASDVLLTILLFIPIIIIKIIGYKNEKIKIEMNSMKKNRK